MQPRCMVVEAHGGRCGRPATVFERDLAELVCLLHAPIERLPNQVEEIRRLTQRGLYRRAVALLRELDERYGSARERLLEEEGRPTSH